MKVKLYITIESEHDQNYTPDELERYRKYIDKKMLEFFAPDYLLVEAEVE